MCIEISPIRQVLPCYNTRRDVACVSWRLVRSGLLGTDLLVHVHNSLTVKFISCRQHWSRLSAKCSFDEMAITTSKKARDSRWDTFCSMWLRTGKFSFIVAKNVELQVKIITRLANFLKFEPDKHIMLLRYAFFTVQTSVSIKWRLQIADWV